MQTRDGRRRLHARRGRPAAPRDGGLEAQGRARRRSSDKLINGMLARGYDREFAEQIFQPDPGLRRVRLSREPRGELRAAGLRVGLAQAPRAGRLPAPRCSTASRWASTRRRSWCATRATTASRCAPSTCWPATGTARSRRQHPTPGFEPVGRARDRRRAQPAVRLGLNWCSGFRRPARSVCCATRRLPRARHPPSRHGERAHRVRVRQRRRPRRPAQLDRRELQALAAGRRAGSLAGHRAQAPGKSPRIRPMPALLHDARFDEPPTALPRTHRRPGHRRRLRAHRLTLRRHPLALLRPQRHASVKTAGAAHITRTAGRPRDRHRHPPPASRHRQGRDLRHARRRNRNDQRHRLAALFERQHRERCSARS